ncbi:MAG TPA: DHA2 family efflux MFS transporter permease subunit [Candidatus Paceibacterota bacterium]|nr:DHA2 family efflux MFS transporter permease subunit [Candidatus Paceibacterota bacterium]
MESTDRSNQWRWWVLATVIFGTFLGRLDQTVVNLALPKIISDFGISVTDAAWISTAYILANAIFVPIWGKLGDTAGRKKIYLIGFVGFTIASGLCGIAWNLTSMIVFRVIQGFAVSADYPTAMAILAVTFTDVKERTQALGLWSASFAVASVFGPLIGGPLIDNFNWRSIFFVNVPLGIIGLVLAFTIISESVGEKRDAHFDWWGSLSLAGALFALTLVLDRGQTWGWLSAASVASYIATVVFALLFFVIESRETEPIVDLKFFRIGAFVYTLINSFIVFMALIGAIFLVPIFAQTFLGYDATQTGYLFIPMAALLMIAAPLGGRLVGKVQSRYVIFTGMLVAGAGMYLFAFLDPRSTAWAIIVPLGIMAFGLGFGMAQRTNIIASIVPKEEVGEASAILALARNIAGAFGVAIFSTILTNAVDGSVLAISQASRLQALPTPQLLQQFIMLVELKAQVTGYAVVFEIAAWTVIIGAFSAFLIIIPNELAKAKEKHERVIVMD